jgi:AsmA protein
VKHWIKILIAVVLLFIALIASIPLFVDANTFRPEIEKKLSGTLGRTVKLGDLRLSIFKGSLDATDLSISDDPNFGAEPFLAASEVRIGVALKPLILGHEVNLRSFQILSPRINIVRAQDGTWNFSSIGRRLAAAAPATGAPANPAQIPPGVPDLSVGRIVIENGRVTIASLPAQGPPSVYENVNLTVNDFSFGSKFPFQLSADFLAAGAISVMGHIGPIDRNDAATSPADAQIIVKHFDPIAAGFLNPDDGVSAVADAEMNAVSDGKTLAINGAAHLQNLKLRKGAAAATKPVDVQYKGTHRLKDNSGEIAAAEIQVGAAAIRVTGAYQPVEVGPGEPQLSLKVSGDKLPIDDLHPLMTAAAVRLPNNSMLRGGTLSLDLAMKGPANAMVIEGTAQLDNTSLVGFDIGSKIHGIAALSGVKTGDSTEFERLRMKVHITNAGVVVTQIDSIIPAMGHLTGSGTVSPDNQLDFNLTVQVAEAKGIGKVGVDLLSKLNGSGGSGKNSGVPLRVVGTPDNPSITADVGGIVTKTTKSIGGFFGKLK